MIKPFDASQVAEVAKAIQASDLGINPNVDGKILRLILPPLSEERRKKLVALRAPPEPEKEPTQTQVVKNEPEKPAKRKACGRELGFAGSLVF